MHARYCLAFFARAASLTEERLLLLSLSVIVLYNVLLLVSAAASEELLSCTSENGAHYHLLSLVVFASVCCLCAFVIDANPAHNCESQSATITQQQQKYQTSTGEDRRVAINRQSLLLSLLYVL